MVTRSGRSQKTADWDQVDLTKIISELTAIWDSVLEMEHDCAPLIDELEPQWQMSAANLLHYLALRRRDIRPLQAKLSNLGLSSLGRAEAHVLASVNALLKVLHHISRESMPSGVSTSINFNDGKILLDQHTEMLLGTRPAQRSARIMVTMPSEAADDYLLVRELLNNGMDCMRINCAHDDEEKWEKMIANLRRARREVGRKCRILMDLAGPKLRTGPLETGPGMIRWRPRRNAMGQVLDPARIWLMPEESGDFPDGPADAMLPLPSSWLATIKVDDILTFTDARGANRELRIIGQTDQCRWAESYSTAYLTSGMVLHLSNDSGSDTSTNEENSCQVGRLPDRPSTITLHKGDILILTKDLNPGHGAVYDDRGRLLSPATIGCTLSEIFDYVRPGERIFFDDGKIGGVIRAVQERRIKVEITAARTKGERLAAEKGINLPDSRLKLSSLTEKDRDDLRFIARHANMVGMSFVQEVDDVTALQALLHDLNGERLGIILKIETRRSFEMLPDLVLAAMRSHSAGVMIARGDLAVECGYERLAEVQEEILWLCEAAHIPVIWATQVLENLAKSGMPSRAEITDAAMGVRAECVMLNKGPHIIEAIRVLDNILQRMGAHQNKKSSLLRQLRWGEHAYKLSRIHREPQDLQNS
ncbi:MAG: pyruvate kinase [Desulfuromonadales bacterium]|nr:pyruvate kinase [Desulfuromonadales bacterium]